MNPGSWGSGKRLNRTSLEANIRLPNSSLDHRNTEYRQLLEHQKHEQLGFNFQCRKSGTA